MEASFVIQVQGHHIIIKNRVLATTKPLQSNPSPPVCIEQCLPWGTVQLTKVSSWSFRRRINWGFLSPSTCILCTFCFLMKPRNDKENLTCWCVRREAATGTGEDAATLGLVPPPARRLRTSFLNLSTAFCRVLTAAAHTDRDIWNLKYADPSLVSPTVLSRGTGVENPKYHEPPAPGGSQTALLEKKVEKGSRFTGKPMSDQEASSWLQERVRIRGNLPKMNCSDFHFYVVYA